MSSPDILKTHLRTALGRAISSTADLDLLIQREFRRDPSRFAGATLEARIGEIFAAAEREGWGNEVLDAIMRRIAHAKLDEESISIPGSKLTVAGDGIDVTPPAGSSLQEAKWNARRTQIERRVCRILRGDTGVNTPLGTGFLVAPSLVLTNWHVLKYLLAKSTAPDKLLFQFDYLDAGASGRLCKLADDWFVACNPARDALDIGAEDLDYALVRLADAPGSDVVGGELRGSIRLPPPLSQGQQRFTVGEPVCIVQHPRGGPLRLAMGVPGVKEVKGPARVTYLVTTDDESSGSPCFDKDWGLFALHRAGAPELDANEGIPIDSIRDDLPAAVRTEVTAA
ncbi:trypsin-like serine peptidase [Sorangium sp. So ce1000]|uniref:trypsin-like serine peptidase n=1 Tax=Sorangium sp. So ce1000 TaxID=3133325 RepID=UPI003F60483C